MNSFINEWINNTKYFQMLELIGKLSKLSSDSTSPYLYYRHAENIFCKYYNADNLARTDTAYDAKIDSTGIGLKTFLLDKNCNSSTEKVAEFDKLSNVLQNLHNTDLARELAKLRNERIELANRLYGIKDQYYHIVSRMEGRFEIFNVPYPYIDIDKISHIIETDKSIRFRDSQNEYNYNKSKSVLMMKFIKPDKFKTINIEILEDPYKALEGLLSKKIQIQDKQIIEIKGDDASSKNKGIKDSAILPLFSHKNKDGRKVKFIPEKSGLNQWNADGRLRDPNEIYIPVPMKFHKLYPDFFPPRDIAFTLRLPDGQTMSAKLCQDNSKALMSNPNKDLGEWLLRKVLQIPVGRIITMNDLNIANFDSVRLIKNGYLDYSIETCNDDSFEY